MDPTQLKILIQSQHCKYNIKFIRNSTSCLRFRQ